MKTRNLKKSLELAAKLHQLRRLGFTSQTARVDPQAEQQIVIPLQDAEDKPSTPDPLILHCQKKVHLMHLP